MKVIGIYLLLVVFIVGGWGASPLEETASAGENNGLKGNPHQIIENLEDQLAALEKENEQLKEENKELLSRLGEDSPPEGEKPYPPERLDYFTYNGWQMWGVNTDLNVINANIERLKNLQIEWETQLVKLENELEELNVLINEKKEERDLFYDSDEYVTLLNDFNRIKAEKEEYEAYFYNEYPFYIEPDDHGGVEFAEAEKVLHEFEEKLINHEIHTLELENEELTTQIRDLKSQRSSMQREISNFKEENEGENSFEMEIEIALALIDYLQENYRYD